MQFHTYRSDGEDPFDFCIVSFGGVGPYINALVTELTGPITGHRLLDRAASVSRHEIAEAERVRCMERLLSHYVPNITFDIQSLRQAVDELNTKRRDSESDVLSTKVDANELEDLAIDEEDFIITNSPAYSIIQQTIGFSTEMPDTSRALPNKDNLSDHYPVGVVLQKK